MGATRTSGYWGVAAAFAVLAAVGCGGEADDSEGAGGGPNTGAPRSAQSLGPELAGDWAGQTSAGQQVRFSVVPEGIASVDLVMDLPTCNWDLNVRFDKPAPINSNAVTIKLDFGTGLADVGLKFFSTTNASGTFLFDIKAAPGGASCEGQGGGSFVAKRIAAGNE